jgi:hypothetical protein
MNQKPRPRPLAAKELTNKTGYDESRTMVIVCPICFTSFNRPPSHVTRTKTGVSCCSRQCAASARVVRISVPCVSCSAPMELIPSSVGKITTCSKKCSTLRRIGSDATSKQSSFGVYKKAIAEISANGACKHCRTSIGPWAVRGVRVSIMADGETMVHTNDAELWCKQCHLVGIAPLGAPARDKRAASSVHLSARR